jgi:hypothetical protein
MICAEHSVMHGQEAFEIYKSLISLGFDTYVGGE